MANERTFLEWAGMAITLGTVSAGLISLESGAAQTLGFILAPVTLVFLVQSFVQFTQRRNLLAANDLQSPGLTSTSTPLALGAVLLLTQLVVLIYDMQGSLVHL
jgi:uncharacterized membrane protein YidH (DUF202 family)